MKKIFSSLLLLVVATTMNAQTVLKGDMNKDGKLTLADLTALINTANDNSLIEAINVYEVNNSTVIGTWYASDGTSLVLREDGTTNYMNGTTYEFMPILGRLLIYDAWGGVVKTMAFKKVTPEYLLEESTINGALTYYTNSAYVVADVALNRTSLSLRTGSTFPLQATVTPVTALNTSVVWTSSDESVATVNDNGMVAAISGGTCTITCTAKDGGGASASCELTVIQLVTDITLSHTSLALALDCSQKLSATILPTNASNKGVTWTSSDESVAEVMSNGFVSAIGVGTCTITCTAKDGSGVSATCEVTVVSQPVTDITLSSSSIRLNITETHQLTANVIPSDAGIPTLAWTSSDTSVATVDQTGTVTAVAEGTCTVTASATDGSGVSSTCTVCVVRLVTGIALSQTSLSLNKGDSQTLTSTVQPSDATDKSVTWTSSDTDIATVDANGMVTAVSVGYCTITCLATDGSGVSSTCLVTVTQLVTDITLSHTVLSLDGDSYQLTATILPSDASNKGVTWTSSNPNVATIDDNGVVTAVSVGVCTITCTATDGSGVSAICEVKFLHAYVDLGLPSGTLWATCNIGADNPEDYGLYFAWGETTGYTGNTSDGRSFNWTSYKYSKGSNTTLTKYCNNSTYGYNGFTDTLTELEPEDDAAYVNWGSGWRMPSKEQFDELINGSYTTTTWTTLNGVYGRKITSKRNGNSLFLPAAGYRIGASLGNVRSYGRYWSRTLYTSYPLHAYYLYFYSDFVDWGNGDRCIGQSVRPVRVPQ